MTLKARNRMMTIVARSVALLLLVSPASAAEPSTRTLESPSLRVAIVPTTGAWSVFDKASGVRWPSAGVARPGVAAGRGDGFREVSASAGAVRLTTTAGSAVVFELADGGRSLVIRYEGDRIGDIRVLDDALTVTSAEGGYAIVPCREGLLIPAEHSVPFKRVFGTSEYEGCHMRMLGCIKRGAGLIVDWDDAYVWPELERTCAAGTPPVCRLTAAFTLRRSARSIRLTPLGKADWNTIAAGYRRLAEEKGLAVTLRDKVRRNLRAERLLGAANVKLWTCLARRMSEDSTQEDSVAVRWTFDEAARIAEHLKHDLGADRCLFILGGWTEGGYDCRHPDNLPANRECGGNDRLADAVRRIQALGYVACLHDNYQDMYRDASSWSPALVVKSPDGSLVRGGRWLGGRAFLVCAPKQLELASRPNNLPGIQRLFAPWAYFIDTTYAAGPCECFDSTHPLDRNGDIAWKCRLSDYARERFGLFGSECGREWAVPHSDFFEGLVGVSGHYFHNLDPKALGATVIPFWEMVYHDCQVCYGKYGYDAGESAEYVVHHLLCARPLHYHSIPEHCYWRDATSDAERIEARPCVVGVEPVGDRGFRIRYAWDVSGDVGNASGRDWREFVHFGTSSEIRFQDDHQPEPPVSGWREGSMVKCGPRLVRVPLSVRDAVVNVYIGLFDPAHGDLRARLPGCDAQRRVLVGRLRLAPRIEFESARREPSADRTCFTRTDRGWAEGLNETDAFMKTTHEILGPLHLQTCYDRLAAFEFLSRDRAVRRAVYGQGDDTTTVVANLGAADATVESRLGGSVVLPRFGFVVEGPRFAAFHAKRWNGRDYPQSSLFTLRSEGNENLDAAARVRVFHGFGDPTIVWQGATYVVGREHIINTRTSQ